MIWLNLYTNNRNQSLREGSAMQPHDDEPCYVISVAAKLLDIHPQTLRSYERLGLISPSRSNGRIRLYSQGDIERLRRIQRLVNDLGVNLAGVEVIMRLQSQMAEMERQARELHERLEAEIQSLRRQLAEKEAGRSNVIQQLPERSAQEGRQRYG